MTECPVRRDFWRGEVDARTPAAFRIAVGTVLLVSLLDRLPDVRFLYTNDGLAPLSAIHGDWRSWSLLLLGGEPAFVFLVYLAGLAAVVAFTLGYRTRLATVVTWLFLVSLDHRSRIALDNGEHALRVLLFWAMFADTGAAWSFDTLLGRREPAGRVPALPVRILQVQVAVIYFLTGLYKLGYPEWRDGTALVYALQGEWARPLGAGLAEHTGACRVLAFFTLAVELAFPFLVFSPWRTRRCRQVAVGLALALHLGIAVTMHIVGFSIMIPATLAIFYLPAAPRELPSARALPSWLAAVLFAQLGILAVDQIADLAATSPGPVTSELSVLGLDQRWNMFAHARNSYGGRWEAFGTLDDGSSVDVLATVLPQLAGQSDGLLRNRWTKIRYSLYQRFPRWRGLLARYLCRRMNEHPGRRLVSFELVYWRRPAHDPGAPPRPWIRQPLARPRCIARGL